MRQRHKQSSEETVITESRQCHSLRCDTRLYSAYLIRVKRICVYRFTILPLSEWRDGVSGTAIVQACQKWANKTAN